MSAPKTFRWKAFVSFYIALSFVILGVSGLILFVAPPGRVANWSVWTLGALTKAQWQAVHTVFSFVFLVAAGFHLSHNWKVLTAYLKTKLQAGVRMKWELGSATTAAVLLLALTIAGVPPFSTLMEAGDDLKNAWTVPTNEPPLPHAEELTVEKLAETTKLPLDKAQANLAARGVTASPGQTLQQIADANRLTPQQVFQQMQSADARPQVQLGGGGWGRKTVGEICRQFDVDAATGLGRLAAAGLDAAADTPLKDLALKLGRTPVDIAQVIVGPDARIAAPNSHGQPGAASAADTQGGRGTGLPK